MDFTRSSDRNTAFAESNAALDHGNYRRAFEGFGQVLGRAHNPEILCQAAVGAAHAALQLAYIDGVVQALTHARLPDNQEWLAWLAADASLLVAQVYNASGQLAEAQAEIGSAITNAAATIGWSGRTPPGPEAVAALLGSNAELRDCERLANAALSLAEIHVAEREQTQALAWIKAAAMIIGRSAGSRSLQLLARIFWIVAILASGVWIDDVEEFYDAAPLDGLAERAKAAREAKPASIDQTPAEYVEGLMAIQIDAKLSEAGLAQIIVNDVVAALPALDALEGSRLGARARFQLARLLCAEAVAIASRDRDALPFEERHALQEGNVPLQPKLDVRIEPLLVEAINTFNADRGDDSASLIGSVILLAEIQKVGGGRFDAETLLCAAMAMVAHAPALAWRVCMMLSEEMIGRGSLATGAFWAKFGLSGIIQASRTSNERLQAGLPGMAVVSHFVARILDVLRRLGRIKEAAEIAEIERFADNPEAVPWTAEEQEARDAMLVDLSRIDPNAPLDFREDAPVQSVIRAVEARLERPRPTSELADIPPGPGVAMITIHPAGNGVSLRLQAASTDWSQTVKSSFPEVHPLAFAVDSLFTSLSEPQRDPNRTWPGIFEKAWVEQVSDDIFGVVPRFDAHTLAFRTTGIFRFLPFAPLGPTGPLVDVLPVLSCPRDPVARTPIVLPPRFAVLALDQDALAGSSEELEVFEKFASVTTVDLRVGPQADRRALTELLNGEATVLHFATHCEANAAEPPLSTLLLGDGSKITLGELVSHDLSRFDLVTLAACASGLPGGAGLDAPVDLLHRAGARRVLTTLWPVDDVSTGLLMRVFYEGLFGDMPLRPAAALRQAQLQVRAQFPHPHFWAGFYLSAMPD